MKRLRCPEDQNHLWPDDVMFQLAGHPKQPEPLPPLPFPRNQEIDLKRCCRILDTTPRTVRRLIDAGHIQAYQVPSGPRSRPVLRVKRSSVVEFCDGLRLKYGIPPRKATRGQWPDDDDVLPFPAAETCTVADVMAALDIVKSAAIKRIDTGEIVAYQLWPQANTPYRVWRPSLVSFIQRLHDQANRRPNRGSSPAVLTSAR